MITKVFLVLGLVALTHQQDPYYYKYATYKPGRQYDNGDRVRVNTEVYQCRPPPYNKFCVKDAFAPTGKQRDKAWFKVEEHKIDQERRDFYLPEYTRHFEYKVNELVQFRGRAIDASLLSSADSQITSQEVSSLIKYGSIIPPPTRLASI